jgi:hypothetical protein
MNHLIRVKYMNSAYSDYSVASSVNQTDRVPLARSLLLEQLTWQAGLADDGRERTALELGAEGNGYCHGSRFPAQLHDGVATLPPDLHESLGGQYATDVAAGQDLRRLLKNDASPPERAGYA